MLSLHIAERGAHPWQGRIIFDTSCEDQNHLDARVIQIKKERFPGLRFAMPGLNIIMRQNVLLGKQQHLL